MCLFTRVRVVQQDCVDDFYVSSSSLMTLLPVYFASLTIGLLRIVRSDAGKAGSLMLILPCSSGLMNLVNILHFVG